MKTVFMHAAGTRLLVVDNCPDSVRAYGKILRLAGFEVATASDGFEALRIASDFQPSITLLDIGLPDIDGFKVARRLRPHATFDAMTLVAVTALSSEQARERAKAVGFDHYLVKPVRLAELLSLLADLKSPLSRFQ